MREIWRKTLATFWEHPVLWLPFIVAELCTFALSQFSGWATKAILYSQMTSRSVLGGETTTYNPAAIHNAWMYSAPISATVRYLNVCLLIAAFVLIARATQSILQERKAEFGPVFADIESHLRRFLWFSVKLYACILAGAFIAMIPAMLPGAVMRALSREQFSALDWTVILAAAMVTAWMTAPMALDLVKLPDSEASPESFILARRFAILAAAGWLVAGVAFDDAIRFCIRAHSSFEGRVLGVAAHLASDVPLLLLFIALAILAVRPDSAGDAPPVPEPEPISPT